MAEYINRDELREALLRRGFYPTFVKTALESLPAIDIVRCKDCKYCRQVESYGAYSCFCNGFGHTREVDARGFCSYGERREQ